MRRRKTSAVVDPLSSRTREFSADRRTGGIFYEDFDWSTGCNVGRIQRSRDLFYLLSFRSQNAETLVVLCGDRSPQCHFSLFNCDCESRSCDMCDCGDC